MVQNFQKHAISNSYINFKNYIKFVVIIYHMIDEEKQDDNELFEEDEVVWAKIKGYPWWPAYINDVHGQNEDEEIQYTVFFFGDNTQYFSSRLGHSKIKKFIDKYTEFYPKSKVNRNLKLSLKKAEQKLAQNGENISVYETLRNSIQGKNKRGRKTCKTDSKKDSSEGNPLQTPQLNKSKTYQLRIQNRIQVESEHHSNPVGPIKEQSGNDSVDECQSSSSIAQQKASPKKRGRKRKNTSFTPPKLPLNRRITRRSRDQKQLPKKKQIQQIFQEQSSDQEEEQQQQENESQSPPKIQKTVLKKKQTRKRKDLSSSQSSSSSSQDLPIQQPKSKSKSKGRPKLNKQKQKPIVSSQNVEQSLGALSPQNQAIIQRVQFSLNNREQLIDILLKVPINITNVKEILDLKVTDILRNGQITHNVRYLLQTLKSILLYKYFPHDGKIKKKYEKTLKKKPAPRNQEQNSNLIQGNSADLQIRRKTVLKLQSIIKKQVGDRSKAMATKIQSFFRIRDPTIGDNYREFAYKILRSLKDKVQSAQNVIDKLENQQYE